jgi:hypothetical protein
MGCSGAWAKLIFFKDLKSKISRHCPFNCRLNCEHSGGDIHKSRCSAGFNDTGGNFATGINNTGGKFCHWRRCGVVDTGGTPVVYLVLRKSPPIFENGPNGMLRGLAETDLLKRPEVKNLVALSL